MAPERPGPEDKPGVALVQKGGRLPVIPLVFSLPNAFVQLKEGDGAVNVLTAIKEEPTEHLKEESAENVTSDSTAKANGDDDDLTSLTWLQDKNLLKGMNLRASVGEAQESPTSDYVEESTSEPADSTSSSGHSPSPAPITNVVNSSSRSSVQKHPQHLPYDPMVHTNTKPPYSFSCLIFMAIEDSPQKALPVKEIYAWILDHFPYFKNAPTGWKNSVRHNLSLNKCFRKVEKAPNLGKGSLWMVDPLYRPNLMQALQKAPVHPHINFDRISMPASKTQINSTSSNVNRNEYVVIKPNGRLPNPELFPYLSRRLAASGLDGLEEIKTKDAAGDSDTTTDDGDSLDDVDAATAMLALKHGPRMLSPRKVDWYKQIKNEVEEASLLDLRNPRKKIRASKITQDAERREQHMVPVITTSPSEDHTYSAGSGVIPAHPSSSPDEAFEEGSESDDSSSYFYKENILKARLTSERSFATSHSDSEEQRKIAEGADALLNLAGISTRKRNIVSSPLDDYTSEYQIPEKRVATRGRRRGGGVFRPRLLRSLHQNGKKKATVQQRLIQKRSDSNSSNNNNNNNNISPGNSKFMRTTIKSSIQYSSSNINNNNKYDCSQNIHSEERTEKSKRKFLKLQSNASSDANTSVIELIFLETE